MRYHAIVVVLIFLLSAAAVQGILIVDTEPLNANIFLNQSATYNVTITNTDRSNPNIFSIYTQDPHWVLTASPKLTSVGPDSSASTVITLKPLESLPSRLQGIELRVKSHTTDQLVLRRILINIKPDSPPPPQEYLPSLKAVAEVDNNGQVTPGGDLVLRLHLTNRNPRVYETMRIQILGKLMSEDVTISLAGLEERTKIFTKHIGQFDPPQKDELTVIVSAENETLATIEDIPVEIVEYSPFFNKDRSTDAKFLKTTSEIMLTNIGNVVREEQIKVKTSWLKNIFTSAEPESSTLIESGDRYLSWKIRLRPDESATITITTNYRSVFAFVVTIVVILVLYLLLRSPVVIRKEAIKIGREEGGISELKILIYVKNRTQGRVKAVRILDKVPSLVDVIEDSYLGSIQPSQIIVNEKRGTKLAWELDQLDGFEERIISYRIKSKLSIIGGFRLPAGQVQFRWMSMNKRTVRSNSLHVLA